MRLRGINRARRLAYTVRRRFVRGAVILMYHRVVDLVPDPLQLTVTPQHFEQHLDIIRRTCQPMRLLDLIEALEQHALPERAIAITFDDGYVDNYVYAYPRLKAAAIPATIFTTASMIDSPREFWWDDLERLLIVPEQLPAQLRVTVCGQTHDWPTSTIEQRQQARNGLYQILKPLNAAGRLSALNDLARWAALDQAGRPDFRAMTRAQLIELAHSDVIEIGGHTVAHPQLASLPAPEQQTEITQGRQMLESIIGRPVKNFAYPYGKPTDFTSETAALARAAGFRAACSTNHGSVESGDDLFALRRCAVFNWDAATFKQKLESFFVARN